MTTKKKQVIRVVFDVRDEMKHSIRLDEDISVPATDPDQAIEWVFAEMQRQFNRSDIHLSRVRICAYKS
ncbi:hypothetical protein GCM10027190_11580 [Spirosoma areae]